MFLTENLREDCTQMITAQGLQSAFSCLLTFQRWAIKC